MKAPTGYVIYRGPSLLNGEPIAVVLIARSHNEKTGDMAQAYILVDNGERPTQALRSGADAAVCGSCNHRPLNGGSCYVVVRQGPTIVWRQMGRGAYPAISPREAADVVAGRMVRLGAYGDPAAVPVEVWRELTAKASGWVGYTHQWYLTAAQPYREFCMASVDTPTEKAVANARGWRTFRVRMADEHLLSREGVCPASEEAGHKLQCTACQSCAGSQGQKGNIAIVVHGAKGPWQPVARFIKWRTQGGSEVAA